MFKLLRPLACAALLAAGAAEATTYQYSYTLLSGGVVSGSFDGTANGNLITGLSNFTVFIDGVGFNNNGNLYTYDSHANAAYATVSFDGKATDLLVTDVDLYNGNYSYILALAPFNGGATDAINYNTPLGNGGEGNGDYSAARWSVSAVPEPATTFMLLGGLVLVGAVARRRKQTAPFVQ